MSLTDGKQSVNTLAGQFSISRQAVSLHLKYLQECGVISIDRQGRQRFCQLELEEMSKVGEWLEPFRKLWASRFDQLDQLLGGMQGSVQPTTGSTSNDHPNPEEDE